MSEKPRLFLEWTSMQGTGTYPGTLCFLLSSYFIPAAKKIVFMKEVSPGAKANRLTKAGIGDFHCRRKWNVE